MTTTRTETLIIGAGLSGIGAAARLRRAGRDFLVVEARAAIGGTWDLFRYPGVRSDSDMFTLSYSFRPWSSSTAIADGAAIRDYVVATAAAEGVEEHIRFGRRVVSAEWSSPDQRWTVRCRTVDGEEAYECRFLWSCTGYYDYEQGFRPEFPGEASFSGRIVHPQHWPEDLEVAGRRVLVIGSGATAVTLVPALVAQGAHVTMLQRSPTWIVSMPGRDVVAAVATRVLGRRAGAWLARWKNVLTQVGVYQLSRWWPAVLKAVFRWASRRQLPVGYPVDLNFTPRYDPWDQRLCLAPDGDFYRALRSGRAEVVTGRIERFETDGVRLVDGCRLTADIVVTATGLALRPLGGLALSVDGAPVRLAETVTYKGMMLSAVPNFFLTVGYAVASWTLRADLTAGYVLRLLGTLERLGRSVVTPLAPPAGSPTRPLIDLQSGYIRRNADALLRQGDRDPWRVRQNYLTDLRVMRFGSVTDGVTFG